MKYINIKDKKPGILPNFNTISVKVKVKLRIGKKIVYGTGYYNHSDDDWLIELYDDLSDEIQSFKGVVFWKYLN